VGVIDANASKMALHVTCDCEALPVIRFRLMGHNYLKPGDFTDMSVRKVLHCVPSVGLMNA
jgi:hypothetical protein